MRFLATAGCVAGCTWIGGIVGFGYALFKAPMEPGGFEFMATSVTAGAATGLISGCYLAMRLA